MNFEIHSPKGQVKADLIDYVRNRLNEIHDRRYEYSMVQIDFSEKDHNGVICQIDLSSYGAPVRVYCRANTCYEAAKKGLNELIERINQQVCVG